jgi:transposase-like protein
MRTVHSLVVWFCSQLTLPELGEAIATLLRVFDGRCQDIRLRSEFREEHPSYRRFDVDTTPPLTEPVELAPATATLDWREELSRREAEGNPLEPVGRRGGQTPPPGSRCERCGAPAQWLYVNDGRKCSQLRCKICRRLFPVRRVRRQASGPFWWPHCGNALYEWKHNERWTAYKCKGGRRCPHYRQRYEKLNRRERLLVRTGMSSQFKLHYQWRVYHFDPAAIRPQGPHAAPGDLRNVRHSLNAVGLALSYSVSMGLSARMTAWALREIHGIPVSHQTVLNWITAAAPLAWNALQRMNGTMTELTAAADETYIKVCGVWHFTWFIIGTSTRAIWAWNVSDDRGEMPAIAVINQALDSRDPEVAGTFVLVGDGNGSYDAAVNAINTDADGMPLPAGQRKVERRTVIGLRNDDEESRQFRPFKQLIERLNRTYRYHTRSRSGHKNLNAAMALTTLFVAHYNFLRPHGALRGRTPLHLPELDGIGTIQGKWLKLLQLAA